METTTTNSPFADALRADMEARVCDAEGYEYEPA